MKTEEFSKIMRDIEIASRYKSIVKNPKVNIKNKILNMQLWWIFLLSSTCFMDQLELENQDWWKRSVKNPSVPS